VKNHVNLPIAADSSRNEVEIGSIVQLSAPTASWALCGSTADASVFTANPVSRPDLSSFRVVSCVSDSLPPALPRVSTRQAAASWSASSAPRIDMALQHLSQWPRLLARQFEASGLTSTSEAEIKRMVTNAMLSEGRILSMAVALEANIMQAANGQAHAVYCLFGQHSESNDTGSSSIAFDFLHPPSYVPLYRDWEWYTAPKISGKATWSEAYVDEGGGNVPMITYSVPLAHEGVFAGVVTMDIQLGQEDSVQAATLGTASSLSVDRQGRAAFGDTQEAFANSDAAAALAHIESLTRAPRIAASALSRSLAGQPADASLSAAAGKHLADVLSSSKVAFGSAVALAPSCFPDLEQRSFYACRVGAASSAPDGPVSEHAFARDPSLRHLISSAASGEHKVVGAGIAPAAAVPAAPAALAVSALPYDFSGDEWFAVPRSTQRDHWSDPYFDDGGGDVWMVTYSVPFFDARQSFAGVVTLDVEFSDTVRKWFAATKPQTHTKNICYTTGSSSPLKFFQLCGKTLSPQGMLQGPLPDDLDFLENASAVPTETPEFSSWNALARAEGKGVRVGDCIQLCHEASGLFLCCQLSSTHDSGGSFALVLERSSADPYYEGSLGTWFRLGSKAQAKGELLSLGDSLTLSSVRWHEQIMLPPATRAHTPSQLADVLQSKGIKRQVAAWCMRQLQATPPSAARRTRTMSYLLMGSATQLQAKGTSYAKCIEEYLLDVLLESGNLLSQAPDPATGAELCMFPSHWGPKQESGTPLGSAISIGAHVVLRAGHQLLIANAQCHLGSSVLGQAELCFVAAQQDQQQHDESNIAAIWQALPDPCEAGCFHLFHVASQRFLCIADGPSATEAELAGGSIEALALPMPTAFSANDVRRVVDVESGLPYESDSAAPLILSRSRARALSCTHYMNGDSKTFEIGSSAHGGCMRLGVPDYEVVVDSLRSCTSSAIIGSDGQINSKVLAIAKLACTSGRVALISQTAVNSSFECCTLPPAAASTISRMVASAHSLRMAATFQSAVDSSPELHVDCAFEAWPCVRALIECCFVLQCQQLGSDFLHEAERRLADDELLSRSSAGAAGGWAHANSFVSNVAPGLLASSSGIQPVRDPSPSAQARFAGLHLPATVINLSGQLLRMSVTDSPAQWQTGWKRKAFLLCHAVLHLSVLQNQRSAETCFADLKSLLAQKAAVQRLAAEDSFAPRLILSTVAEALEASPTLLQLCPTDTLRDLFTSCIREEDGSLQESLLSLLVQLVARPLDAYHSSLHGLLRNVQRQPIQDALDWRISARNQSLLVQLLLEDNGLRFIHARLGEGTGQLARSLPESAALVPIGQGVPKLGDSGTHASLAAFLRLMAYLCVGDCGKRLRAVAALGQLCSFDSLFAIASSEAMNQSRDGIRSSCLLLLRVLHLEPYLVKDRPGTGPFSTGPHSSTVTHTSTVDSIDGSAGSNTQRQGSGVHRHMEACGSSSTSRLHPLLLLSEPHPQPVALPGSDLPFPDIPVLSVARSRTMVSWIASYLQNSVALAEKNRVTLLVLALLNSLLRRGAVSRQDLPKLFSRCCGVLSSSQEQEESLAVRLDQVKLTTIQALHLIVDSELVWSSEDALASRNAQSSGAMWIYDHAVKLGLFPLLTAESLHCTLSLSHSGTSLLCRLSALPDELVGCIQRAYAVTTGEEDDFLSQICQLTSTLREVTVWERTADSSQDLTVTDLTLRTGVASSLLRQLHAALAQQPEHLSMPSFIHCGLMDCLLDLVHSPLRVFIEAQRSAQFMAPSIGKRARGKAKAAPLGTTKAANLLRNAAKRKLPRNFLAKMRSLASRSGPGGFVGSELLHGVYGLLCDAAGAGAATLELLRQNIGAFAQHIHISSNAARLIARLLQSCPEQDIVAGELAQVAKTLVHLLGTTAAAQDTAPLLQCILAVLCVNGHQDIKDAVVRSLMSAVQTSKAPAAADDDRSYGSHMFWQLCHLHSPSLLRSVCEQVFWRVGEFDGLAIGDGGGEASAGGAACVFGLWLRIVIQGAPYRLRYVQGMAVRSREESAELLQSVLSAESLINGFLCCPSVELKGLFLKALEQVYGPQSVLRPASGCCHLLPRGSVALDSQALMAVIMQEGLRLNELFLTGGVFSRQPNRSSDSPDPSALLRFIFDTFCPFLVVYFHGCFDSNNPDPAVVAAGSGLYASLLDTAVNCLSLMGTVACKSTVVKDGKEQQSPLLLQTARTAQRDAVSALITAQRLDRLVNALEHMRDPAGSLRGTGVLPSTAVGRSAANCSRVAAASDADVSYIIQALQDKRQGLRQPAPKSVQLRPNAAASGAAKESTNPLAVVPPRITDALVQRMHSSRRWQRFREQCAGAFVAASFEHASSFFPAVLKLLTLDAHATRLVDTLHVYKAQLAPFSRPWIVASPGNAACILQVLIKFVKSGADHRQELLQQGCAVMVAQVLSRAHRTDGSRCRVHVAALNLALRLGVDLLDGGFEPAQQAFLAFTQADPRNEFMASLLSLLRFNRLVVPKFAPVQQAEDEDDDGSTVFERASQSTIAVIAELSEDSKVDLGADAGVVQSWQQLHLAMQLIQQLCEGHFTAWQDELRTQENQSTQYDIISSLTETLAGMMCDAGPLWYALVYWTSWFPPAGLALVTKSLLQLLATLTEVVQGPNFGNQQNLAASRLLSAVSWTMDAVNTCYGHARFPLKAANDEVDFGMWHSLLVQYATLDPTASTMLGSVWDSAACVQGVGSTALPHSLPSAATTGPWLAYSRHVAHNMFIDMDDDAEAQVLLEARHSILLRVQASCCCLLNALLEGPLGHGYAHQAMANSDINAWLPVTLAHQLSLCASRSALRPASMQEQQERLSGGAWDTPSAYVDICTRWYALLTKLALHHGVGPDMDVRPALQRAANLLTAGPTAATVQPSTQALQSVHGPAFTQAKLGDSLQGLSRVYSATSSAVLSLLSTVPVQALRQLCHSRVGHIEIMREGRLEPFVYEIPDIIQSFRQDADYLNAREAFLQDVNRDNAFTRVEGLFNAFPQLMFELVPRTGLKANVLARYNARVSQISFLLALVLNVMLLTGASLQSDTSDLLNVVVFWIAVAAAACSGVRFVGYMLRKLESWSAQWADDHESPKSLSAGALVFAVQDPVAIFNAFHLAATVAAVMVPSDLLVCVQLLDFIIHSALLRSTLSALASYGGSLAATASLWAILLYVFAAFGHASFAEDFPEGRCDSLTSCVWFTLNFGLRAGGGVGDFLSGGEEGEDSGTLRSWYDVVFFILLTVVMSSIVTGIIIDSFSAARDHRAEVEDNQSSECFVCGLERSKFDREGRGFDFHCSHQHNMWQYVYALAYLRLKESTEYTGAESFIAASLQSEDLSFFPVAHSTLQYSPVLVAQAGAKAE